MKKREKVYKSKGITDFKKSEEMVCNLDFL
jgi:hypothetical protein